MPYVITTMTADWSNPAHRHSGIKASILSRTAVATLGEARTATFPIIDHAQTVAPGRAIFEARAAVMALPESGGTIGPLPDSTVIEVRRVKWRDITNAVDLRDVLPTRENMIDAFNAA